MHSNAREAVWVRGADNLLAELAVGTCFCCFGDICERLSIGLIDQTYNKQHPYQFESRTFQ